MKDALYVGLMCAGFILGWYGGIAGYEWTKWYAAPVFMMMIGMMVRFFWMK